MPLGPRAMAKTKTRPPPQAQCTDATESGDGDQGKPASAQEKAITEAAVALSVQHDHVVATYRSARLFTVFNYSNTHFISFTSMYDAMI